MQRTLLAVLMLACTGICQAETEVEGQLRLQWTHPQAADSGPLAQATRLQPGIVRLPADSLIAETELRVRGHGLAATATLQAARRQGDGSGNHAWINELYASGGIGTAADWQWSAGKKIVAWDVGYAFRPNDMVQKEDRLALTNSTAEGRPVLMAEHFNASTAWSLVLANPDQSRSQTGAKEPALAARLYQRDGALDWHGFARMGAHTGVSLGGAVAWVAADALEIHASARLIARADSLAIDPKAIGLVSTNPWKAAQTQHTGQILLGATWTSPSQVSLLAEAWWDGTALADSQWDQWFLRNRQLAALAAPGATAGLVHAVAGNLVWQAGAFNVSSSLRRSNLFVRLSGQHEAWHPALDMLCTPADKACLVTASLLWHGDRTQIQTGLRVEAGNHDAVLAQLPTRRIAYVTASWSF